QEVRSMAQLWCMPLVPLIFKAPRHALDFAGREQLFAIMRATGIEDEAGFDGELGQLGAQLRTGVATALPDRLEDRWGMAAGRTHHLCPLAKPPGGRSRNLAPAAIKERRVDRSHGISAGHHAPPASGVPTPSSPPA